MSKALRTVGMVVGAVALVATGVGALAGAGVLGAGAAGAAGTVAGISTATITAVGTYASLAAGVLSMASAAAAPGFSAEGSATTFQTNPQSGLPYAMGRTRMSGLRVYARTYDGFKQQSKDDILAFVALLSIAGPIHSIEKFTADNELVTFAPNGDANGRFYRYMAQSLSLGNSPGSALALQFGGKPFPEWGANHRLNGIAHAQWALRFDTDGNLYGAGAPEPAWVGKWVKVYDPRKDSTYPGGSGPHRALNEATYEWSDNPGLHALTWALGRWQNGKRVCGIGAPVANIRVAEFVECANVCDANGWKVGGVEWTTDSKWDTLKRIMQAGGAIPTQTGAMIGCLVSTPRTAIATIEGRHLLDGLSIAATKSRRDRFNTVIPRYVDEDSDWAVISGTAVTEPSYVTADGGQRTKEIDFPLVQVFSGQTATQPGQLAAYAIVNSREAGPFTWTTGPEWIGLKTGDVVLLNVPEEGLVNQPVLITRRAPDPSTGKVSFAGETETNSKHAYALGQTTTPPTPFEIEPPDITPPAPLKAIWSVTAVTIGAGYPSLLVEGANEYPGADNIVIRYRAVGAAEWRDAATLPASTTIRHLISPLAGATSYEVEVAYQSDGRLGAFTVLDAVTTPTDGFAALIDDINATLDSKRAIFVQQTAPTAAESQENDWWNQTDASGAVTATYRRIAGTGRLSIGGNAITIGGSYITLPWVRVDDQRITNALAAATAASNLADSKAVVFTMFASSDPVPVGTDVGDLLVRAYLNPTQIDRWDGSAWQPAATFGATAAQLATLASALEAAENAQATADGKIDTFYSDFPPSGASLGDLWFETDNGNALYRHNGSGWLQVRDSGIAQAITAAAGAQATADGKVTTFTGEGTPTASGIGDLWYKPSDKTMRRWNGSSWAVASPSNVADGATVGAPSGTNVGSTPATTVEAGGNAANGGLNSDGTVKTDKVATGAIQTEAVTKSYYAALATTMTSVTVGAATEVLTLSVTGVAAGEVLRMAGIMHIACPDDLQGEIYIAYNINGSFGAALTLNKYKFDSDGGASTQLSIPLFGRVVAPSAGTYDFFLYFINRKTGADIVSGTAFDVMRQRR